MRFGNRLGSHGVIPNVNINEALHREVVGFLVYRRKLGEIAGFPVAEDVSVYPTQAQAEGISAYTPTLSDLPKQGWVWYDESEGTNPEKEDS